MRAGVQALVAAVVVVSAGVVAGAARGAILQPFVTSGLTQPLFATAPAGDTSRLFVLEKGGNVRVIVNGVLQTAPYATVSVNTAGERGLLGMAFAPDFATSGNFYLDYISSTTLNSTVERFTVANPSANTATSATRTTVFTATQTGGFTNHKGGWIGFRPGEDSNLYIATGDGGSSNDPNQNAQNLSSPLGKMHRINVSGTGVGTPATGNPFIGGTTTADDTVWAYGLRNPFRNSFDRTTGNFYIGDVGQDTREELDVENGLGDAGRNYGWRSREGTGDNPAVADPAPAGATNPVFDYTHTSTQFASGSSGSITGGYVYRGPNAQDLFGKYIFADYVSGKIGSLNYDPITRTVSNVTNIDASLDPTNLFPAFTLASFGEDGVGGLYVVNINGSIYRVTSPVIAGDYNRDGRVDAADYTVWADHFGQTGTPGSGLLGDGNNDGVVDAADYTIWADNFGRTSPGLFPIPEAGGMSVIATVVAALSLKRRR